MHAARADVACRYDQVLAQFPLYGQVPLVNCRLFRVVLHEPQQARGWHRTVDELGVSVWESARQHDQFPERRLVGDGEPILHWPQGCIEDAESAAHGPQAFSGRIPGDTETGRKAPLRWVFDERVSHRRGWIRKVTQIGYLTID